MDGKSVLIFLTGATVGGVGTWLGVKEYYSKKAQKELDERWNDIQKDHERYLEIMRDTEPQDEEAEETPVRVSHLGNNEDLNILRKRTADYKSLAQNYGSYYEKKSDEDEPFPTDISRSEEEHEERENLGPYEVESEDAGYGVDLSTVSYYTEDDILVDDLSGEELSIEDTIGMIGRKARLNSDEEAVYIRNEKIGLDYEVLKVDDSYERMMREKNELSDD